MADIPKTGIKKSFAGNPRRPREFYRLLEWRVSMCLSIGMTPWLRAALLTPHISRTTSASVLRRGMASSADHVTNFQSTLSNPELFQTQAFIDGEFVPGSGGTYEVKSTHRDVNNSDVVLVATRFPTQARDT